MDGFTPVAEKDSRTDALLAMSVKRVTTQPTIQEKTSEQAAGPYPAGRHSIISNREATHRRISESANQRINEARRSD